MLILTFLVAVSIPLRTLSRDMVHPVSCLMSSSKIFHDDVTNDGKAKLIVSTLIQMGIVLSNAYKNHNVYKMITPRMPDPYAYFKELVEDNLKFTPERDIGFIINPTFDILEDKVALRGQCGAGYCLVNYTTGRFCFCNFRSGKRVRISPSRTHKC